MTLISRLRLRMPATVLTALASVALAMPLACNLARPAIGQDTYYESIAKDLKPLVPRSNVLGDAEVETMASFKFATLLNNATMSVATVGQQPFDHAIVVSAKKCDVEWKTNIEAHNQFVIRKDDVLYVTLYAKVNKTSNESGDGLCRLYVTPEPFDAIAADDFTVKPVWKRFHFGMIAQRDYAPGDLRFTVTFGELDQTIEIGGIAACNLGPGINLANLPQQKLDLNYRGREADAIWRKEALARIEKIRKGPLTILLVDRRGKPIRNANVHAQMLRHDFVFGTSISAALLPGTNFKDWGDFKRVVDATAFEKTQYQQHLLQLFNTAHMGMTWTSWAGDDKRFTRDDLLAACKWLKSKEMSVTNVQVVYPRPEFTPSSVRPLMDKAHAPQFAQAIKDHIYEMAKDLDPYIDSFQIANELYISPQYTDVLGHDAIAQWFRWAHAANPRLQLMINENDIISAGPIATAKLKAYLETISWLKSQGAPLDYIGEQSHMSAEAIAPVDALKIVDKLATSHLPIEITEFEMTIPDGKSAVQRAYQRDYTRDYLIAMFSHPAIKGIILQDFWQPAAWQLQGNGCFFNEDWSINPNGTAYIDLVLHHWWTDTKLTTDARGQCTVRGFCGLYRVTIVQGGKTQTKIVNLKRDGSKLRIVM